MRLHPLFARYANRAFGRSPAFFLFIRRHPLTGSADFLGAPIHGDISLVGLSVLKVFSNVSSAGRVPRSVSLDLVVHVMTGRVLACLTMIFVATGSSLQTANAHQLLAQVVPTPAPLSVDPETQPLGPQHRRGEAIPHYVHYVAGDIIAPPLTYNEFAPGNKGNKSRSYAGRAAAEFAAFKHVTLMVGTDFRRYDYQTVSGPVTSISGIGPRTLPSFEARDYDIDGRVGVKLLDPRIYAGAIFYRRNSTTNGLNVRGAGYGVEKLADVDERVSLHGNFYVIPSAAGNYAVGTQNYTLAYKVYKYAVGASIQVQRTPLFLDAGFLGDKGIARSAAPVGFQHQGPYVGLGARF